MTRSSIKSKIDLMRKLKIIFWIFLALLLPDANSANAESTPEGMVLIKGGCFMMGTDQVFYYEEGRENTRERPAHKVCLDSFYMDITEVTQKKWQEFRDYNNSPFKDPDMPISHVDWREARNYCKAKGHRLPTEAEWEYAARAGSQTINPWGDDIDTDYLWFAGNSVRKTPKVATRKANAFGLHDMMGSLWEWVEDWYSDHYYEKSSVHNPQGPEQQQSWRVIRGPSWLDEEEFIRVTIRLRGESDPNEDYWVGFRCVASVKKK